jgi:hypothetical protein
MSIILRCAFAITGSIVLGSCARTIAAISDTQPLVSAEPVQTEFVVTIRQPPEDKIEQVTLTPTTSVGGYEKQYLGYVLIDSGKKCQAFADRLSAVQRGIDTSFDILTGTLSALATALHPLGTVHALTAAATISTGTKTAIDANVYAKATAALILQEINRTYYVHIRDYRNKISTAQDVTQIIPTLEVSEIEAIHRECSLDAAVASLSQVGVVAATTIGAASGAAAGATAAVEKNLPPATGAIAGALAGATAGAAAAGAPAASQAAATAGKEAGATAAAPPAAAGAGARALPPRAASGISPAPTGATTVPPPRVGPPKQLPLPGSKCTDENVAAEVANGKKDLIQTLRKLQNKPQLDVPLDELAKTTALREELTPARIKQLQDMSVRSSTRAIQSLEVMVSKFVCTKQELDEVRAKLASPQ